ncbi:DNA polymerase III subunit delta' [Marinicrinis lubricantis]|uniref:DNA polymerase III subunit delta' n=1 Tax=Marinicrinis lubricantis TaxID=2086470 RepID=A0ABW1IQA6_9BACL
MSFQQIQGQDQAKRILQTGLRKDRLSHAYLFAGPSGTGKRQMAVSLAKAVFCLKGTDDACGECIECRKVEHYNHPHLYRVEPDGLSIKIGQIRNLQKEFSLRSDPDQMKIYIIEQADKMTSEAANSLLKFLEEPGSRLMAVLITDNGQAVLPTIHSRAQYVPFSPLPSEQMTHMLEAEGHSRVLAKTAARLASGLDGARTLIQLNAFAELRTVMIQLAKEALTANIAEVSISIQQKVTKTALSEHLDMLLDLLLLWFRDMLQAQTESQEQLVFEDEAAWLKKHTYQYDAARIVHWMEDVLAAKKQIRAHVNPQLALERLFIQMKGG